MKSSSTATSRPAHSTIVLIFLLAAFLSTLFCSCASPLFRIEGALDQCCFLRAGAAWASGMLPYADFVDVKGPLLFLLHKWAWQLSPGSTWGMWGMETAVLALTLLFLYKIARVMCLERSPACISAVLVLPLILMPELYGGGARVEMYTSCALAFLLWQTCRFYDFTAHGHRPAAWYGAVTGLVFGICLLLKYNACAPAVTALACACAHLLHKKATAAALVMVGCSALAVAAACLPFVIYLVATGTWEDCLNVYFTLNAETLCNSSTFSLERMIHLGFKAMQDKATLAGLATLPFLALRPWRARGYAKPCTLFLIGVSAFASAFVGNFPYYLLYCAPLAAFPAIFACSHFRSELKSVVLVGACIFLALLAGRLNGSWNKHCHLKFTQKLSPDMQAMESAAAACPNGTIMFLGTLDWGTGLLSAKLLPACPEWFTLNGAPPDFVQRQYQAIRNRKPDFVVLGHLNLAVPEAELVSLLESSGYTRFPVPGGGGRGVREDLVFYIKSR